MKRTQIFESADGTTFETRSECKQYEELETLVVVLSNLHPEGIRDALNRDSVALTLANAFERAGSIIAAKRRADGVRKRAKKQDAGTAFEGIEKAMAEVTK